MPKNKGRGGKNYKRGKNENISKRVLELKEEGQDYAHVYIHQYLRLSKCQEMDDFQSYALVMENKDQDILEEK